MRRVKGVGKCSENGFLELFGLQSVGHAVQIGPHDELRPQGRFFFEHSLALVQILEEDEEMGRILVAVLDLARVRFSELPLELFLEFVRGAAEQSFVHEEAVLVADHDFDSSRFQDAGYALSILGRGGLQGRGTL